MAGLTDRPDERLVPEGVDSPERRSFLVKLSLGLSALIGALLGVPVLGYLLAPLLNPPRSQWIDLGPLDQFPLETTTLHDIEDRSSLPYAGLTALTAVWVRREEPGSFTVFAVNCTHLGCPVNWLATANLFLCPCHGGVYYRDGSVAAGPPQHSLYEYNTLVQGGRLLVETMPLPPAQPWTPPRLPRPRRPS
jgi:menaquinol-cytochrome c reductase iron-sulfur subunit